MALTKILNDENKSFKPVLTDKLVYDTKPTVNSFNGITSDAVARAIAGASGEVPAVTESDNGKILTAIYDAGGAAVKWADAQGGDVDQTYDATSTNAQSGVAVASAIAAIPSEVSTASGHFDLEGSVPVKVNYTGTASTETQFVTLSIDASKGVGTGTCGFNTENNKSLGANTATLVFKEPFVLGPAASFGGFNVNVFYGTSSSLGNGPTLTLSPSQPTLVEIDSNMCIAAQSVTLSGANPLGETYPQGEYIGVMVNGANTAIIAASMDSARTNGSIEIQHYPKSVTTGYETTIPVIATPGSDASGKVLTVTDTQGNYGWQPVPQELPTVTGNAGKVLTVNSGATGVEWAAAQGGLPSSTGWDAGKVLTVDSQGTPGWATPASPYASFNTTFDLISRGTNVWPAYVQQSSSPAPTIDLPEGVYAYRVEGYFVASAAVDDVYNIEVRVGNYQQQDYKAIGLQSDSDNAVSFKTSGILNIQSGYGISKAQIYVAVNPAKSSTSPVASTAMYDSVQLKLARL